MIYKNVTIAGINGLIGNAISDCLLRSDHHYYKIRGLQRSDNMETGKWSNRLKLQKFNLHTPSTFDTALQECDTLVISISAPHGHELDIEHRGVLAFAKRAEKLGVKRIIYISGITTPHASEWFKSGWAKLQTEEALLQLSIPVHILRPSWVMESLSRTIRNGKISIIGSGKMPIHWVSACDLSSIVDSIINNPPKGATAWNILGPEAIPLCDAAQQFGMSLGIVSKVNVMPLPIARLASVFAKELKPIVELSRTYQYFDERNVENNLPVNIRPKTRLKDWISDNKNF